MNEDDKLMQEDEESSADDNQSPYKTTMRRAASIDTILKERGQHKWKHIMEFILKGDPRTTFFVYNQLRYMTGQNRILKYEKKR